MKKFFIVLLIMVLVAGCKFTTQLGTEISIDVEKERGMVVCVKPFCWDTLVALTCVIDEEAKESEAKNGQ